MSENSREHLLYQKMLGMKGKFNIEFHNLSKYEVKSLDGAVHHWDHSTGIGKAELNTNSGRLYFEFGQVKKIS